MNKESKIDNPPCNKCENSNHQNQSNANLENFKISSNLSLKDDKEENNTLNQDQENLVVDDSQKNCQERYNSFTHTFLINVIHDNAQQYEKYQKQFNKIPKQNNIIIKLASREEKKLLEINIKIQNSFENQNVLSITKINDLEIGVQDEIELGQIDFSKDVITVMLENQYENLAEQVNGISKFLNIFQKMEILLDIALGLKSIHSNQVSHFQIKFENIKMTKSGWKISQIPKSMNKIPSANQESSLDVSNAEDVYDFGILLFQLITDINIPDEGDDSLYSSENLHRSKLPFVELLNFYIDLSIKKLKDINIRKFKTNVFQIFTKCTRSNPAKRISIQSVLRNLFEILELNE